MQKIKIIDINSGNQKEKDIEIEDSLFDIAIRKGLIEENENGYYFIGDYEELLAYKIKKSAKKLSLSDWIISHGGGQITFWFTSSCILTPSLPPLF